MTFSVRTWEARRTSTPNSTVIPGDTSIAQAIFASSKTKQSALALASYRTLDSVIICGALTKSFPLMRP